MQQITEKRIVVSHNRYLQYKSKRAMQLQLEGILEDITRLYNQVRSEEYSKIFNEWNRRWFYRYDGD